MTAESEQVGCPIRYTLRHFAGQAPGYDTGVTRFELFVPLAEYDGSNLLFCDLQPMLYNDGNWGSNLGLGYRWYSPAFDRVFGLYGYFDYRQTTYHRFQQGTLGFDSLGNWIDARGNLYLPDGEQKPLPAEAVAPPHFQGHRLLYGGYERALLGGDVEVGVRVPLIGETQSRVLGGLYWFDGDDEQDVQGWKVRLETHWTANVSTDVAVYDDDVFGTTLMVGVGFNVQAESFSPFHPQIRSVRRGSQRHITNVAADRVAEPVCRLPNIAVRQGEYRAALEGEPWQILHVVENATGGDGSFERPFGTLDQAMAVAQDGYLVYTPYGGTYQPTPMFVVPEGVSLLSNAQVHYIPTDAGWLQLPLSGASPDLSAAPQILGSVTLSDRATLDGFWVVGYGDTLGEAGLVRLAGASDATVANNVIWSRQEGIWIEDAMNVTVVNNTVAQSLGSGIWMRGATAATLTGNRIADAGGDGLEVLDSPHANLAGNEVDLAAGSGIRLTQGAYATVSGNTIGLAGENGIEVLQASGVTVSDNAILDVLGDGILVADAADATVTGNAIGLAGRHGIELIDAPAATVADNWIGAAGWHGIAATDGTDTQIRDNAIGSAGGDGIHVAQGAETRIVANEIGEALGNGIALSDAAEAILSDNRIGTVGTDGIWVGVATSATVESNVVGMAGGRGIVVLDGLQASVQNNEVQWALLAALDLQGTDNAILTGNRILASAGDGIRVASAGNVEISRNELDWIEGSGIVVVDTADARITENAIAFAGRNAIQVAGGADLLVSRNTIARAIGNGIDIQASDLAGSLLENSVTDAQSGLQMVLSGVFEGAISDNILLASRVYGMSLEAGQFATDSLVSTNWIESSGREGLRILVTGPDESTLIVSDNVLILNHAQDGDQQREFLAGLASGAGPMIVELRGNASYNLVPSGEFNFDFFNASGSTLLYVTDPGAPNVGTLGSSDGSVPSP
ncbi:MAG: right-handed parallel beta-helix repeat-containing protein [Pirellulaceae bacterium]|nr:right-handed parallel beta-helix repeat-containing protein [Pirellulaceae bacterium]